MIPRVIFVLAVAGALMAGAGVVDWVFIRLSTTAEEPAATSGSGAAVQSEHRKRFFSGDPDRSVHGGQEMKPRW